MLDEAVKSRVAELKAKASEFFKNKQFQEALDTYGDAVQLDKGDAGIWVNRSITNRQLERWADAAEDAELASLLEPHNAKAFYSMAVAFQQLGDIAKAKDAAEKGLKVQPDNKALQQLKAQLANPKPAATAATAATAVTELQEETSLSTHEDEAKCPASGVIGEAALAAAKKKALETYTWKGEKPSRAERARYRNMLVDIFRSKYAELAQEAEANKKARSTALQTDQYAQEQKLGLQLTGGHRPMARPSDVKLPASHRQWVGELEVEDLAKYDCNNEEGRFFLSVYGEIFDVSDRPDKYGRDGPYNSLTGKDITWGLFTGLDQVEYCNRFYDLFKAKDAGTDKLMGLCSWQAWYEKEYGKPVGKLKPWLKEELLPAPPLEEVADVCTLM